MRLHFATLAVCFALGLATCAQASSRPQDKDKDKDTPAKHAPKAQKVKIIHSPVVESAKPTTATIAWSTNTKASTILKYGTDSKDLNRTAEAPWGGPTHRVYLKNLKPGTTYYYRVESTEAQGTGSQVLSGVEQFRTEGGTPAQAGKSAAAVARAANVKVTHGPVVEGETANTATIAWSTNVNASTILKYGTNQNALNQAAEAPWGGLTHRVNLRHLSPGTTYYYRVESTEAQGTGTQAVSGTQQFKTKGSAAAAATPAPAARTHDVALNNFHQFLAGHPDIKAELHKNPELVRNGHYMVLHPGFNQFLQSHPGVRQRLAQNPKNFVQSEEMMR